VGYRRFVDGEGGRWEIRIEASGEWRFEPVSGNPRPTSRARPPLYARDPFELSEQELQRILGGARPIERRTAPSPFGEPRAGDRRPLSGDDGDDGPARKRSPFLDDR